MEVKVVKVYMGERDRDRAMIAQDIGSILRGVRVKAMVGEMEDKRRVGGESRGGTDRADGAKKRANAAATRGG